MEAICLRRTKEQNILGLPQKIMKICSVDLSAEERELYDQMEVEAKTAVQDYISTGSQNPLYSRAWHSSSTPPDMYSSGPMPERSHCNSSVQQ